MQPQPRTQLVYKQIPAGGGTAGAQLNFDNVPELEGCLIVAFEFFTDAELFADPNRVATLTAAEGPRVTVTLADGSDLRFKEMPFTTLIAALNNGVVRECDPFACAWQASYWKFNAAVTAGTSLVGQFWYIRPEDLGPFGDPEADAERDRLFSGWRQRRQA